MKYLLYKKTICQTPDVTSVINTEQYCYMIIFQEIKHFCYKEVAVGDI